MHLQGTKGSLAKHGKVEEGAVAGRSRQATSNGKNRAWL